MTLKIVLAIANSHTAPAAIIESLHALREDAGISEVIMPAETGFVAPITKWCTAHGIAIRTIQGRGTVLDDRLLLQAQSADLLLVASSTDPLGYTGVSGLIQRAQRARRRYAISEHDIYFKSDGSAANDGMGHVRLTISA